MWKIFGTSNCKQVLSLPTGTNNAKRGAKSVAALLGAILLTSASHAEVLFNYPYSTLGEGSVVFRPERFSDASFDEESRLAGAAIASAAREFSSFFEAIETGPEALARARLQSTSGLFELALSRLERYSNEIAESEFGNIPLSQPEQVRVGQLLDLYRWFAHYSTETTLPFRGLPFPEELINVEGRAAILEQFLVETNPTQIIRAAANHSAALLSATQELSRGESVVDYEVIAALLDEIGILLDVGLTTSIVFAESTF